ncbi:Hypothetical predicted protein [Xyrichtys novacula]|uniref:Uncharacterized protein n=1 Tax=Xyrichtys novacula TaxID=13765 RepID=A0AAV1H3Q5_XYRNO|nr:Hypothetical predicted protein [Xyrichtys novacula]
MKQISQLSVRQEGQQELWMFLPHAVNPVLPSRSHDWKRETKLRTRNGIEEVIRALKSVAYTPTANKSTHTHKHTHTNKHVTHYRVDSAFPLLPQCRAAGVITAGRQRVSTVTSPVVHERL